ncbi:hypothetical protein Nham_1609 [Nitrobacter hamburgensis X14]|uniref:Mor transcription activator domain-containing protein n=1 Tax=Nitrobacter hamburgensis (strain DSM 10229 / NCIMB 13809 / X14) TaxID=323097 RepID=Q1QMW9_NITHX|nr:hypothetical protein [Nitrobacter hamburgensis]ABE62428.1 hypothetical protein Nham_1609 [Nitrobacter hamburgensis X14]
MAHALPEILDEIASVIGHEGMLALVAVCGGTRPYIPTAANADHWLVTALGQANATALCEHFFGEAIEIPAYTAGTYLKLSQTIQQLDDGKTVAREVARKAGVTQRTIYRHRQLRRKAKKGA